MATMKRAQCFGPGDVRVVDVPKPTAPPGAYMIKVAAVGLNPTDWKHANNGVKYYTGSKATSTSPFAIGSEGSGTVVEGPDGGEFKAGDKVLFLMDKDAKYCATYGTLAEYVVTAPPRMMLVPPSLDMETASSIPIALLTAYQSMKQAGYSTEGSGAGKSCLIHAGAGGVGHMAIQLAKLYGFSSIVTTCSSSNEQFVKSLGATNVVDYHITDFVAQYSSQPFDLSVDAVGGEPTGCCPLPCVCCPATSLTSNRGCCTSSDNIATYPSRTRAVTKSSGHHVGIITGSTLSGPGGQAFGALCSLIPGLICYKCTGGTCGPHYVGPYLLPGKNEAKIPEDWVMLKGWLEKGVIRSHVSQTMGFDDLKKGLSIGESSGHVMGAPKDQSKKFSGKIVVTVAPTQEMPNQA